MRDIQPAENDIIAGDTMLNKNEAQHLQERVEMSFQPVATARSLLAPDTSPSAGTQFIHVDKMDFDEAAEEGFAGKGSKFPGISTTGETVQVRVPKMGRAFKISREDLLASRENGQSLETSEAEAAATATGQTESYLIMQGTHGVPGLFDDANTEYPSNTSSGHVGGTVDNIETDYKEAVGEMPEAAQNREITAVVPKDVERGYKSRIGDGSGNTYMDVVERFVDNVETNSYVPSGQILLKAEGADVADYKIVEDLETVGDGEAAGSEEAVKYHTRLRAVPIVKKRNGLVEITGA